MSNPTSYIAPTLRDIEDLRCVVSRYALAKPTASDRQLTRFGQEDDTVENKLAALRATLLRATISGMEKSHTLVNLALSFALIAGPKGMTLKNDRDFWNNEMVEDYNDSALFFMRASGSIEYYNTLQPPISQSVISVLKTHESLVNDFNKSTKPSGKEYVLANLIENPETSRIGADPETLTMMMGSIRQRQKMLTEQLAGTMNYRALLLLKTLQIFHDVAETAGQKMDLSAQAHQGVREITGDAHRILDNAENQVNRAKWCAEFPLRLKP